MLMPMGVLEWITWPVMISIIWLWYDTLGLHLSTSGLSCQHCSMVIPGHVVSGGVGLWKKSVMRDCLCILCANVRVPLCF